MTERVRLNSEFRNYCNIAITLIVTREVWKNLGSERCSDIAKMGEAPGHDLNECYRLLTATIHKFVRSQIENEQIELPHRRLTEPSE